MKIIKIISFITFLITALVVGSITFFISTFDANLYKKQIISLVSSQTGRQLTIDGDLKLAVYPDIAIEMGNTSLSNAAGFARKQFATIGSARVSIELLPLLKKQVKIDEVHLNGLKLNLHRKVDGSTNWDDLASGSKTPKEEKQNPSSKNKPAEKIIQEMMDNLSVAGVSLKNAHIHWQDDQSNQDITLSPLNLKTGSFKPGSPLPVDLSVMMKQKKPPLKIKAEAKTTVTLNSDTKNQKFSLANLKLHTLISGAQIPNGALDAHISGNFKGSTEQISAPDLKLLATLDGDLIPQGQVKINLSGNMKFNVNKQLASVSGMKLDSTVNGKPLEGGSLHTLVTGNTQFNLAHQKLSIPNLGISAKLTGGFVKDGTATVHMNGNTQFDLANQKLSIPNLDVDTKLTSRLIEGGTATAKIKGNTQFDLANQKLSIPNLNVDAKLTGGLVKGGAATVKLTGKTQFDLAKQFLTISGLKLDTNANGELLKGGKARSKIAGDLQLNLAQTQIKMPAISINTLVNGGLVPGGNLSQQAQGNIDLNWGKKQGAVNLSSLQVKLADLELKGSQLHIQPLAEKPSVKGQFQTNTFNLKKVLKMLGIKPPTTSNPSALSQVQAQFSLNADTENAELQQLKLKLDKSSITGKFAVKNFSAPSIQPELKIDHINIDDYLAPTHDKQPAAQASVQTNQSQELLPLETLRGLDIKGGISIGSMLINQLSLSKINSRIKAKQGLINIDPANASLYKGKYKGKITLDARQATPSMKMHHELIGLRSEGLLFDLFADKYISGDTKLITDFNSKGNTITSLLQNLNGTTSIAFKDGTIRDSKLADKVSLAIEAFEKKEIKGDKSVVTFTGLSGDWKTTNGVFKTDNLSLKSPYLNISGTGTADVAKQELDIKLQIGPKTKKGNKVLFAPLHIYGSFSNPKFRLDLKDLLKSLAQQDLDELKRKAKKKLEQAKKEAKAKLEQAKKEAKEKLRLKQQQAKARLKQKELAARAKLDAKKKALQRRLANEKAAREQQLRKKVEDAKAKALQQIDKNIGGQLGDQLKDKLGGSESTDKAIEDAEDEIKNKLKEGLRGLF